MHEAAFRCCCRHVIQAMMNINPHQAVHLDARLNSPLHLLFSGIANRRIQQEDMEQIVDLLLQPLPIMATNIRNCHGCSPIHCATTAPETMVPQGTIERLLEASPLSASRAKHLGKKHRFICQCRNVSVETAQLLLSAYPDAAHARERSLGYTPLHFAAANSNRVLIS